MPWLAPGNGEVVGRDGRGGVGTGYEDDGLRWGGHGW